VVLVENARDGARGQRGRDQNHRMSSFRKTEKHFSETEEMIVRE